MSLAVILQAISDRLPEGVRCLIGGAEQIFKAGTPPRIVLEPTAERITGPGGGQSRTSSPTPARALLTRNATVTAHLWGRDLEATEELIGHFWRAVHNACPGSYEPGEGQWGQDGVVTKGNLYTTTVTFRIPITRSEPTVILQQPTHTTEIDQED